MSSGLHCCPVAFFPVTGVKCSVHMAKFPSLLTEILLEKPRSQERSQPVLSYERIGNFRFRLDSCEEALRWETDFVLS